MIRIFATAMLALACFYSYSQKFPDSLSEQTIFLRFNPLGLADLKDMNISLGAEKRITGKSSLALDAAFVFYSEWQREQTQRTRGFIIRPAYRFFPGKSNFFIEAELHYKQVTHRLTDWVGRDIINGVPSYEEFTTFRLRRSVKGAHIKVGRQYVISNRIWLELYLGIGPHIREYKVVEEPGMRYMVNDTFFRINTNEREIVPAMPGGFRLLYRLSN